MAPVAYAHTMDKSTLFTDVPETAANIQDIMVLHSIGLLGYNGKDMALNPTDNLSRKDFAGWVGGFFGLEGATVDEPAQATKRGLRVFARGRYYVQGNKYSTFSS